MYLSKKEPVKQLKKKIIRIYNANNDKYCIEALNFDSCRLWKLNPLVEEENIISKAQHEIEKEHIIINAQLLDNNEVLEDSEIGDTDIVLVEFKIDGNFKFINKKLYSERLSNSCGYCKKYSKKLK